MSIHVEGDINDCKKNGFYFATGAANRPAPYFHFIVMSNPVSGFVIQFGFGQESNKKMYCRSYVSNGWSDWVTVTLA